MRGYKIWGPKESQVEEVYEETSCIGQESSNGTTLQDGHCTCLFLSPFFLFFIKLLSMPYPVVCLIDVYIYHSIRLAHWETVRVQGKLLWVGFLQLEKVLLMT